MRLSSPLYLRLRSKPFEKTPLSIREHWPQHRPRTPGKPLLLITFHPGYLAGSYQERDYFEHLTPLLLANTPERFNLRLFTVNHPGYDLPCGYVVDRFHIEPYRVLHQPQAMAAALTWLFEQQLAREEEIMWIAYGHSMGGLALSQLQIAVFHQQLSRQGRRLHARKILSAPAFCLHPHLKTVIGRLDGLHLLKQSLGRFPFYESIATSLYQALAPTFFSRDAARYSIQAFDSYGNYGQMNPFIILEQGRELLRFPVMHAGGPDLLANTHVIIGGQDGMLDLPRTRGLIQSARDQEHTVWLHTLDSTHLLELDTPAAAVQVILEVITREDDML